VTARQQTVTATGLAAQRLALDSGPVPRQGRIDYHLRRATSPDDVWAVEFNGIPGKGARLRVLSWDGTGWAVTAGSFPGSGGDVVPLSVHDAWFFDGLTPGGATWHYNGHSWLRVRSGSGLTDGSALSPDSIWAVGTGHRETIGGPVVVLHFNGHHWTRVALNDAARDPVGQVIPDGNEGLIPTSGFESRWPSRMRDQSRFSRSQPPVKRRCAEVSRRDQLRLPGIPRAGRAQPPARDLPAGAV
jgi:hypothetical protein